MRNVTPTKTVKDKKTNDNKWRVLSQKTQAKVSRSYMQNGEARTEQEELFGTPQQVQQGTGPRHTGESTHLEWVHTWTDVEREYHENTTNGVTKRREVRTIQTFDFGNGLPVPTSANPAGQVYRNPEDEPVMQEAMDKTDYLKNFTDQLDDRVKVQDSDNKRDHTSIWLAVAGLALLLGVVVATLLFR